MISKGKATIIITDFKNGFNAHKLEKEAKKLPQLLKHIKKYDQSSLISRLKSLGYDVNSNELDRPSQVEELLHANSSDVIDLFDEYYDNIKENSKLTQEDSENLGCTAMIVASIAILVGFVLLISGAFSSGGKDGHVLTEASWPNADTDTSSNGTLSLKATSKSKNNSRDTFEPATLKLVVITPEAKKGKLRLIHNESEVKPFEIIEYVTNGLPNDAHTSIDIPLTVKEIRWEKD